MPATAALLRIDDETLEIFVGHPRAQLVASFAQDEHEAFRRWLAERTSLRRWHIVVDGGDESHQLEALPQLRGRDRRALIRRRLQHWFDEPIYARAESLGIDRQRKRERFLFSGLNRSTRIAPLISIVQQADRRIDRMVTASALLAHFLPALDGLIVSFSPAGMRLTVSAANQVRLSRLFPPRSSAAGAGSWQAEFERTLDYARTLLSGPRITLCMVATPATANGTILLPDPSATLARVEFDPGQLAPPLAGRSADDSTAALLSWLQRAPSRLGWTLDGIAPPRRRLQAQLALMSGILLCTSLGLGVMHNHRQSRQLGQRLQTVNKLAAAQQQAIAELAATLPDASFSAAQMTAIVAAVDAAARQAIDPLQVFVPLSAALEELPALELSELSWSALAGDDSQPPRARVTLGLGLAGDTAPATAMAALLARLQAGAARPLSPPALDEGRIRLELELPLATVPVSGGNR